MTLFAEVKLTLTSPQDEVGLLRTATAAVHEHERYTAYSDNVQVTLRYGDTSTQVVAGSTPEELVAAVKYKLDPAYRNEDNTSQ